MLDYISGQKGTGKTRMLTETAIYTAQQSKGNVVFAEYGSKISRILPVSVRHIDMKQPPLGSCTVSLQEFVPEIMT